MISEPAGEVTTEHLEREAALQLGIEREDGLTSCDRAMVEAAKRDIRANIARATAADRATIAELQRQLKDEHEERLNLEMLRARDVHSAGDAYVRHLDEVSDLKRIFTQQHEADAVRVRELEASWRCFHCSEVFTDAKEAALHFGDDWGPGELPAVPACKLNLEAYRNMERDFMKIQDEANTATEALAAARAELEAVTAKLIENEAEAQQAVASLERQLGTAAANARREALEEVAKDMIHRMERPGTPHDHVDVYRMVKNTVLDMRDASQPAAETRTSACDHPLGHRSGSMGEHSGYSETCDKCGKVMVDTRDKQPPAQHGGNPDAIPGQPAQGTGLPAVGETVAIACEIADVGTVFQRARVSDHGFSVNEIEDSPGDPGRFGPFAVADEGKTWRRVQQAEPAQPSEPLYPCAKCGKMRTKAEGGAVLATCEGFGFNCDGTPEEMRPSEPAGEVTITTDNLDRWENSDEDYSINDALKADIRANIARATAAKDATIADLRRKLDALLATDHEHPVAEPAKPGDKEIALAMVNAVRVANKNLPPIQSVDDVRNESLPWADWIVAAIEARRVIEAVDKARIVHLIRGAKRWCPVGEWRELADELLAELATDHEQPVAPARPGDENHCTCGVPLPTGEDRDTDCPTCGGRLCRMCCASAKAEQPAAADGEGAGVRTAI